MFLSKIIIINANFSKVNPSSKDGVWIWGSFFKHLKTISFLAYLNQPLYPLIFYQVSSVYGHHLDAAGGGGSSEPD